MRFTAHNSQLTVKTLFRVSFTFLLVLVVFGAENIFAAKIYIEPDVVEVGRLEEFKLDIKIDTEGEEINAIGAEIIFDSRKLNIVDVLDGASVISIWVERAVDKNGVISFSGLIPGGYSGLINPGNSQQEDGLLASLIFRPQSEGVAVVEVKNTHIFANDGKATPVATSVEGASVSVVSSGNLKKISSDDITPPEIIEAKVYKDPSSGDYFLAFYGQDSQSGIAYFEVRTEDSDWESTQNPYYLGNRPHKDLFVKAVDKAGNIAIVKVEAEKHIPWGGLLIVVVALLAVLFLSSRKTLPESFRSV